MFLKIAPDMDDAQIKEIAQIIEETKTDGVIVNNTTVDRSNLTSDSPLVESIGAGGLSGLPVYIKANQNITNNAKSFITLYPHQWCRRDNECQPSKGKK